MLGLVLNRTEYWIIGSHAWARMPVGSSTQGDCYKGCESLNISGADQATKDVTACFEAGQKLLYRY